MLHTIPRALETNQRGDSTLKLPYALTHNMATLAGPLQPTPVLKLVSDAQKLIKRRHQEERPAEATTTLKMKVDYKGNCCRT